ncbi:zinc finger protein, putative [Bodo saltans]|uniref:Zinc finger protein, putative n=1 Tax=Bodo saltans TaxID=75058 RepID=A0A0S4IMU1_BODSA|nr:zinc finger protein, putative [Bodo saltans]|eukprot:CUE73652.1 zinc finger protein, putative [Bodo saltans]
MTADPLEFFEFDPISNDRRLLECPVCLDPWRSPQEVSPCGHIFCRVCLRNNNSDKCMVCRATITEFKPPNRYLVQMALALTGKCSKCEWIGTAEQFEDTHHAVKHRQDPTTRIITAAPVPPSVVASAPPSCSSNRNTESFSPSQFQQSPNMWDEYGLKKTEYDLVLSAISSASRHHLSLASSSSSIALSPVGSSTSGSRNNRSLGFAGAISFARLMGYPSLTVDVQKAFQEFGVDHTNGALNDHQLLLWSSTMSHRRRSELSFGLNHAQLLDILCELHESVDFRRHVGVITTPQEVGYIRSCRATALLAGGVQLPPPPTSTASADLSMHRSIYLATRGRVGEANGGYPENGVLLVDVLEALASEDDGFELCAASPRGGESSVAPQRSTMMFPSSSSYAPLPQQEPRQQQQAAPIVESRPMAGGPYHFTPALHHPPQNAPYYAPLHPSVVASPPTAPYAPYTPYTQPLIAPYSAAPHTTTGPSGYPVQLRGNGQQHHHHHHHRQHAPPPQQTTYHQRYFGAQANGYPYQQPYQHASNSHRHHGMPQPPQVNYYGMPPPPAPQQPQQPYYGY